MAARKGSGTYGKPLALSITPDMDSQIRRLACLAGETVSEVVRWTIGEGLPRVAALRLSPDAYDSWAVPAPE